MIQALQKQLESESDLTNEIISTIYFGGGTPSLLTEGELSMLIEACISNFQVGDDVEITLEANPDDITPSSAKSWFRSGVNRLSIGIQSFHQHNLSSMNRAHDTSQAKSSIEIIKEVGFTNYSVDLMFALPDLSNKQWIENLQVIIDEEVPHLSCYNLTIEERTALKNWIDKEKIAPLSELDSVNQFKTCMDMLSAAGYEQYEISNYALPGMRSRHNSAYWKNENYIGIGPSAHSYINGERSFVDAHNQKYIKAVNEKRSVRIVEKLSEENQYNEWVMTKLRTLEGLSIKQTEELFPQMFKSSQREIEMHIRKGNLLLAEGHLKLSHEGKFIADIVAMDLFI